MMAAVQPFLSGAISKTVNMPEEATVDEIANVYTEGWRLGLKAIAIYRDGSKRVQPLNTSKEGAEVSKRQAGAESAGYASCWEETCLKSQGAGPGHGEIVGTPSPRFQIHSRHAETLPPQAGRMSAMLLPISSPWARTKDT